MPLLAPLLGEDGLLLYAIMMSRLCVQGGVLLIDVVTFSYDGKRKARAVHGPHQRRQQCSAKRLLACCWSAKPLYVMCG